MEYGIPAEDIEHIKEVFRSFPKIEKVLLFGSRAMGNYSSGSDIDLVVVGDAITFSDMLDISDSLDRLGMLYTFDMHHLDAIKDPEVTSHIARVAKELYAI